MSVSHDPRPMLPPSFPPAPQGAAPDPFGGGGGGIELSDILRMLKQRKATIIVTFVIVFVLSAITTVVLRIKAPGYQAEAFVELLPPAQESWRVFTGLADPKQLELQVQNEARKLKELGLLRDILDKPEVRATAYVRAYSDTNECLYDLRDDLGVAPLRDSSIIRVTLTTRDPKDAQLIVDQVISEYISRRLASTKGLAGERLTDMRDQKGKLQEEIKTKRDEIRKFRDQTDVPSLEAQHEVTTATLHELQTQLTAIAAELADYEARLAAISDVPVYELPVTPEMKLQIENDPIVRYRREQAESIEIQIQAMLDSEQYGENHRQIVLLRKQRDGFRDSETAKREELMRELQLQQRDALEQGVALMQSMQIRLQEDQIEEEAKQRALDRNIQDYRNLEADRDRLEEQMAQTDLRIAEAQQEAGNEQMLNQLVVRQRAQVPPTPTFPNIPLFLTGGFMLALMIGLGLAFLREFADQAVRTPIDVARNAQVSVLGCVPELDDEEADIDAIELASLHAPQSLVAESFRQIRTNLIFSGPADEQRSLLITSPGADDGKTAIAVNLAVTLAQSGERVLLIDANFRRPALKNVFNDSRPEGLSNILIGQGALEDYATATQTPNLDLLASGPMPPTPAELLSTKTMRKLIEDATSHYDRVIIDGPPVLLMSDAHVLAMQVAGVIIVSRAANHTKGALKRAADQLQRIGVHLVGAVLNGVKARAGGYFRRQYREFYDYVSDETVPRELPAAPTPPAKDDND